MSAHFQHMPYLLQGLVVLLVEKWLALTFVMDLHLAMHTPRKLVCHGEDHLGCPCM